MDHLDHQGKSKVVVPISVSPFCTPPMADLLVLGLPSNQRAEYCEDPRTQSFSTYRDIENAVNISSEATRSKLPNGSIEAIILFCM